MKALMFGWEFPPHILGGLGTASYGLTKGMWECGDMDITFVIPKPFGDEDKTFAHIIGASQVPIAWRDVNRDYVEQRIGRLMDPDLYFRLRDHIYADFNYMRTNDLGALEFSGRYPDNLLEEINNYSIVAGVVARTLDFDIIHSHDWLTYPAGIHAKQVTGKPMVIHVHATEFDRSRGKPNPTVFGIEKDGMNHADHIITVSNHTRDIVINNYGVDPAKVTTVHNAVTPLTDEQIINLFMNLETFGEMQSRDTGIFQFLEALPRFARERGIDFWTPSEAVQKLKAVGELSVMHPISWADEARDTSAWLGNKLQQEAFDKLYSVAERVRLCDDRRLKQDWNYLQASDHFFYMATKHFADGAVHSHFSPYDTPFQAFTNYMNVLADFIVRVEEQYPLTIDNEELNSLLTTIRNQEREIEQLNKEVSSMRQNLEHYNEEHLLRQKQTETAEKPAPAKKKPGRKPAAKKA